MIVIGWGKRFHSAWNKSTKQLDQTDSRSVSSDIQTPKRRGVLVVISEDAFFKCLIKFLR